MGKNKRILVVDDDYDILIAAELLLKDLFKDVICCEDPQNILQLMEKSFFDIILLDMNFSPGENSGATGLEYLRRIIAKDADAVVVMITAHGDIHTAVEAMKHGATDFISKPWQNEKIIATISSAVKLRQSRLETGQLKKTNKALLDATSNSNKSIIGSSEPMVKMYSLIERSAPTDANVLILGENGTGKELIAKDIHCRSERSERAFMSIDLGAVSETLFESELFGHKKGAFTGATKDRVGRIEAANGGTLFLDEIGNIPIHLQSKLLTILEQRKVTPLGSNRTVDIDVRIISATNLPSSKIRNPNVFRQDLFFRLNTLEIFVPPLRDRGNDIIEIANFYAKFYANKYSRSVKHFSSQSMKSLIDYHWPGNVRALRHSIERAVILSETKYIEPDDLQLETKSIPHFDSNHGSKINDWRAPFEVGGGGLARNYLPQASVTYQSSFPPHYREPSSSDKQYSNLNNKHKSEAEFNIAAMEQKLVKAALEKHSYNITKTASELGLTRATLYRRIEKYGF